MTFLAFITVVTATLAALTKIIDVVTTIKYVGAKAELNPIGRWLFKRLGCAAGCWLIFAFEAIVFAIAAWQAVVTESLANQIGFSIIFCLFIWGHISAGIFNTTGHATPIVRIMLKLYRWRNQ